MWVWLITYMLTPPPIIGLKRGRRRTPVFFFFFFCEVRAQWHQPRHVGAGMAVSSVAKRGNCLLNFLVNTIYTTWSLRFTRSEHMWDWQLSGFYKRFPFTPSSPEHFKMNSEVMSTWRTEDGLVKLVRKWNIFTFLFSILSGRHLLHLPFASETRLFFYCLLKDFYRRFAPVCVYSSR